MMPESVAPMSFTIPIDLDRQVTIAVRSGGRAKHVAACCCGALMLILMVSGFITECAGLSHTRDGDLGGGCPSNYWNGAAGLLSVRAIFWVFLAASAALCWAYEEVPPCTPYLFGVGILPLTLSNTALTAQAWEAVNCTRAMMEHNRDADPLIAAGSSVLLLVDWVMLLAFAAWMALAAAAPRRVAPTEFPDEEDGCISCCSEGCCCRAPAACCGFVCAAGACACVLSPCIVFIIGLVYAHGKDACPSAFWPFAMASFFILPCCTGSLSRGSIGSSDAGEYRAFRTSCGPFVLAVVLGLSIAAIVLAADALQSDDCKRAMGNDGAAGPLLAIAVVMYATFGLIASVACVLRCVKDAMCVDEKN